MTFMRGIIAVIAFFMSSSFMAQDYLPEGWDKIILEGKPAYMNINTGEISRTYPKGVARRKAPSYTQDYSSNYTSGDAHIVERGETLSKIARKYGMGLGEVYKLNPSINFNKLAVGQEININDSSSGRFHRVRNGETLYRIATNNGLSISELKSINNLRSNTIRVGQKLRLE